MKYALLSALLLATACVATPAADVAPAQVAASAPKPAISPAGDWHGEMTVPPGAKLRLGIHVDETSPGVFTGTTSNPDAGLSGTKWDSASYTDGVFTWKIRNQSFAGRYDAAQDAWIGEFTSPMGALPVVFKRGVLPAIPPNPAVAGLDGRWEGKVQGMMTLVVRVSTDVNGTTVWLDSPMQNAAGMVVPTFRRDGAKVTFAMPSIMATYEGTLSPEGDKITGTWTQGMGTPLELKYVSADLTPAVLKARSQTPAKPYPYQTIEIGYDNPANPGVHIPCTLSVPEGAGPHPAALLLSGSGAQDRDETLLGHKPFLVLADHLTKKGIAVLRCDDRDFVKPRGDGQMSSLVADFVTDAKSALAVLRARPEIDAKRVGVIGHSEGGVTGPQVAAQDPSVAFVVTLAGIGVSGRDALLEQRALLAQSFGASEEIVATTRTAVGAMFDQMLAAPDQAGARAAAMAALRAMPVEDGAEPLSEETLGAAADQFADNYYRDLLAYDPTLYVPKITAPFLAINGSKDIQVASRQNLDGFRVLLANNKDATFVELPGLNHLFQTATTGSIAEYGDIDETFAPAALEVVSDWIVKRMKP